MSNFNSRCKHSFALQTLMLEGALSKHHTVLATDWWTERPECQFWWTRLCCGGNKIPITGTIIFTEVFLKFILLLIISGKKLPLWMWTAYQSHNIMIFTYTTFMSRQPLRHIHLAQWKGATDSQRYCRFYECVTKWQEFKRTFRVSQLMKHLGSESQISELIIL